MNSIFLIIVIIALVLTTLIMLEPRFDWDRKNGQLFLWYNGNDGHRHCIYICPIKQEENE